MTFFTQILHIIIYILYKCLPLKGLHLSHSGLLSRGSKVRVLEGVPFSNHHLQSKNQHWQRLTSIFSSVFFKRNKPQITQKSVKKALNGLTRYTKVPQNKLHKNSRSKSTCKRKRVNGTSINVQSEGLQSSENVCGVSSRPTGSVTDGTHNEYGPETKRELDCFVSAQHTDKSSLADHWGGILNYICLRVALRGSEGRAVSRSCTGVIPCLIEWCKQTYRKRLLQVNEIMGVYA